MWACSLYLLIFDKINRKFRPLSPHQIKDRKMASFGLAVATSSWISEGYRVYRSTLLAKMVVFSRCMVFKVRFRTLKMLCHGEFHIFWSKLS